MSLGSRRVAFPNAWRSESRWSMASILKRPLASARRSRFVSLPLLNTAIVTLLRRSEGVRQFVQAQVQGVAARKAFLQRHRSQFVPAKCDHVAKALPLDQVNGGDTKPRCQNPVENGRRPTPLEVSQHGDARLIASTTITRRWASAVGCSLSQASMTVVTAVSNPMV